MSTMSARRRVLVLAPAVVVIVAVGLWLCWPSGSGTSEWQAAGQVYQVRLAITDPHRGDNTLSLDVNPSTVDTVTVEPVMPQMGHALPPVTAQATAPGKYQAQVLFSMTGQWEIAVSLHGPSGTEQVVFGFLLKG